MSLFQSLPPTQYDIRFSIGGIPVRVHPLFWLVALLLGSSGALIEIPIWIIVVFVSILIHELGHALAFRFYGIQSQIVLHAMGGLTIPESTPWGTGWANVALSPRQEVFVSLAGPFSGFLLAAFVMAGVVASGGTLTVNWLLGFIPLPAVSSVPGGVIVTVFAALLVSANFFWGLINLMPIYPLDGGNVARYLFIQYDPFDGARNSMRLSVIAGGIVALVGLLFLQSIFMALMFGFLAFQNYQSLQSRYGRF